MDKLPNIANNDGLCKVFTFLAANLEAAGGPSAGVLNDVSSRRLLIASTVPRTSFNTTTSNASSPLHTKNPDPDNFSCGNSLLSCRLGMP
jgi:hypothetical protein